MIYDIEKFEKEVLDALKQVFRTDSNKEPIKDKTESEVELILQKINKWAAPDCVECHAERVRDITRIFQTLSGSIYVTTYSHGGARKGPSYNKNKENIRLTLSKKIGLTKATIGKYLNHALFVSSHAMEILVQERAGKEFFEKFNKVKMEFISDAKKRRFSEGVITYSISKKILESWKAFNQKVPETKDKIAPKKPALENGSPADIFFKVVACGIVENKVGIFGVHQEETRKRYIGFLKGESLFVFPEVSMMVLTEHFRRINQRVSFTKYGLRESFSKHGLITLLERERWTRQVRAEGGKRIQVWDLDKSVLDIFIDYENKVIYDHQRKIAYFKEEEGMVINAFPC